MSEKKLAVLFSGGKDSCLALHKVVEQGHQVTHLLNIVPKTRDSFMFHKPELELLSQQAQELGIELILMESKGEKEKELQDLIELIKLVQDKVEGIVVGGIASSYQGNRIKKICDNLDLEFIAPLWDCSSEQVWKDLLDSGFKVILTKISCDGLSKEWLGRIIDSGVYKDLKEIADKYQFRTDFEGGEAESCVLFMPGFKKEIKIDFDIESEGEFRHFMKNIKIKNG